MVMKKVVSVSLGSSKRDHIVETKILKEDFIIERRGTNGDLKRAKQMLEELDGQVDALGLGGIDLFIRAGDKCYTFRDAKWLIQGVKKTPVLDGSGLKNTLEKEIIINLSSYQIHISNLTVLLVCGVDRPGMAEAFHELGNPTIYGDLIFALGLPIPIKSLKALKRIAKVLAPIICQFPFKMLYPTGEKQQVSHHRFASYYNRAHVIAGDFHFIKKNLPSDLTGKIFITNTVTSQDVMDLKKRGAHLLITTTPNLGGRSFGTNVLEAILVALNGQGTKRLTPRDYRDLIIRLDLKPRIERFHLETGTLVEEREDGDNHA